MAMIRQKNKNLILSMILGMIVTAIPLGIYGGTMTYKNRCREKGTGTRSTDGRRKGIYGILPEGKRA